MAKGFTALFSRMNFIDRWGLMRNSRKETLSEHCAVTSCMAHVLAETAKTMYGAGVNPEKVAVAALYHDISETLTGDRPTPVKYRDADIRDSYKRVEHEAEKQVVSMLPDELQPAIGAYITGSSLNEREKKIVKAADKLSALIKCIEEERSGNTEFVSAKFSTVKSLGEMDLPELDYFMENFLPAYSYTLDQLMK